MNLTEAKENFMLAIHVDGRTEKTLTWYEFVFKPFIERYGYKEVSEITPTLIRSYIKEWMDRSEVGDVSEETVKSIKRGLHSFWRWVATEYTLPNPMGNITYPGKPKQRDVPQLTEEEITRLLEATAASTINPERDSLIIWMLLDTGIRSEGLRKLKWKHIDTQKRTLYVVEKGRKGRVVAFSLGTAYLLRKWQHGHGRLEYVFYGNKGRPLSEAGLYGIVRRNGDAAGIDHLGPHHLRHNFAMSWMAAGGDIVALKNQMGHEDIRTTINFYLRFGPSQLVAAHRSPVQLQMMRRRVESKKPASASFSELGDL